MTIDETEDSYDPVVAKRFQALDQVPVPEPQPLTAGQASTFAQPAMRRSPRYLLAAAAAVIALIGVGAFIANATLGDDSQDVATASETVEAALSASDGAQESTTTANPAADDPDSESASSTESALVVESPEPEKTDEPATSVEETSVTTATTEASDAPNSSTTTSEPEQVETITAPQTTQATSGAPTTRPTEVAQSGPRQVISGTLREVFTDCVSLKVLAATGEVVDGGPITCDGGSYVRVGDIRVQTSTGLVGPGTPTYNKHSTSFIPGQNVSIVAIADADGRLTLGCDECAVSISIHG